MTNTITHHSDYFYGNKISDYGLKNGYVDYRTLAKSFNAVMCNDIISKTADVGYWEPAGTAEYYYENDDGETLTPDEYYELTEEEQESYSEHYYDVYQWFIVDSNGAKILSEAGEILYYNSELDIYIWGVTHYGTSWDYVLTNIKIEK